MAKLMQPGACKKLLTRYYRAVQETSIARHSGNSTALNMAIARQEGIEYEVCDALGIEWGIEGLNQIPLDS
jgi:hypothetical protein